MVVIVFGPSLPNKTLPHPRKSAKWPKNPPKFSACFLKGCPSGQKTREGCGHFWGLCRSSGGKSTVCKLGALQKASLRKIHFSGDFLEVFDFLRSTCSLGISQENPLNLIKSPIFTNTPCKPTCLYNAPSMHTVEKVPGSCWEIFSRTSNCFKFLDSGTRKGKPAANIGSTLCADLLCRVFFEIDSYSLLEFFSEVGLLWNPL